MKIDQNKILMGVVTLLAAAVVVLAVMLIAQEAPEEPREVSINDSVDRPEHVEDEYPEEKEEEKEQVEVQEEAPVFFSTMTHLEGDWDFVEELEAAFDRQADYLRVAMDYAEQYDAILTFESEMPFARAMVKWDDNVFQEALDRGMGIGTHCDTRPTEPRSVEAFAADIAERKALVDALVDSSENLGCAGAGGLNDWYGGMVGAGFKYIDGLVGFHYMAMPMNERPEGWNNRAITSEYFHDTAPVEDELRYYPFRVSSASFNEDPSGELVVSAGDIGEISSIGDQVLAGETGWGAECSPNCAIDMADVDAIEDAIRNFVETRDTSRVAKLQVYISTQKFTDPGIELFFERMQALQDEGVIQWASQKEVYEAFVEWENK